MKLLSLFLFLLGAAEGRLDKSPRSLSNSSLEKPHHGRVNKPLVLRERCFGEAAAPCNDGAAAPIKTGLEGMKSKFLGGKVYELKYKGTEGFEVTGGLPSLASGWDGRVIYSGHGIVVKAAAASFKCQAEAGSGKLKMFKGNDGKTVNGTMFGKHLAALLGAQAGSLKRVDMMACYSGRQAAKIKSGLVSNGATSTDLWVRGPVYALAVTAVPDDTGNFGMNYPKGTTAQSSSHGCGRRAMSIKWNSFIKFGKTEECGSIDAKCNTGANVAKGCTSGQVTGGKAGDCYGYRTV